MAYIMQLIINLIHMLKLSLVMLTPNRYFLLLFHLFFRVPSVILSVILADGEKK